MIYHRPGQQYYSVTTPEAASATWPQLKRPGTVPPKSSHLQKSCGDAGGVALTKTAVRPPTDG